MEEENRKLTGHIWWNGGNRGLMNINDLGSPSAAATFWDLKDPSGNWK